MLPKIILFLLGILGVQGNVPQDKNFSDHSGVRQSSPGIRVLTWNIQPERERANMEPVDEDRAGFATNYKAALDFIEHQAEERFDFFGFQAGYSSRNHFIRFYPT